MHSIQRMILLAISALAVLAACADKPPATKAGAVICPPGAAPAAAQVICIYDSCGNGKVDTGEACDDGNLIDGDGCSSDCQSTELCGNNVVDRAVGEVCDDGNHTGGDLCCADCRSCPELAMHDSQNAEDLEPAPSEPACTAAELRHALAQAQAARRRADAEATRADSAMEQAHVATKHSQRLNSLQTTHGRVLQELTELRRANEELERLLELERKRIAQLRKRTKNGRSFEL